jgi:hypothetical protein
MKLGRKFFAGMMALAGKRDKEGITHFLPPMNQYKARNHLRSMVSKFGTNINPRKVPEMFPVYFATRIISPWYMGKHIGSPCEFV